MREFFLRIGTEKLTWITALQGSGIFLSIRITHITDTTQRMLDCR